MVKVTDRAAVRIHEMQEERGGDGQILRLRVDPGGCSGFEYGMSFDEPKENDVEVESGGIVLLIDPVSGTHLKGSEVDFDDGLQGKGFEIRNPNATSTCGCGRSFS